MKIVGIVFFSIFFFFFKSRSFLLCWVNKAVIFQIVLSVCLEICVYIQFLYHLLSKRSFVPTVRWDEQDRFWENI